MVVGGGVPSDYFVSAQLPLWLFCCWGCCCCWAETINDIDKEWTYKGTNLSKEEERGQKSLCNRIRKKDIAVASRDKSNIFAFLERAQYIRSGLKHTKGDIVIMRVEVK